MEFARHQKDNMGRAKSSAPCGRGSHLAQQAWVSRSRSPTKHFYTSPPVPNVRKPGHRSLGPPEGQHVGSRTWVPGLRSTANHPQAAEDHFPHLGNGSGCGQCIVTQTCWQPCSSQTQHGPGSCESFLFGGRDCVPGLPAEATGVSEGATHATEIHVGHQPVPDASIPDSSSKSVGGHSANDARSHATIGQTSRGSPDVPCDSHVSQTLARPDELEREFDRGHRETQHYLAKLHPGDIPLPRYIPLNGTGEARRYVAGVIAFYFAGRDETWDATCQAQFLSNFFDVPGGFFLKARQRKLRFRNAEAAFQALKQWNDAKAYECLSGQEAFDRSRQATPDWDYAGFGHNWAAMTAVIKAKFAQDTPMANALLSTGANFILEHTPVSGRESVWSDDFGGNGTNWLGMLLMLRRDELSGRDTWTSRIKMWCNFGDTGKPSSGAGTWRWQDWVKRCAGTVNNFHPKCSTHGCCRAAAKGQSRCAPSCGKCQRSGCTKPSYNGRAHEYCSKTCKQQDVGITSWVSRAFGDLVDKTASCTGHRKDSHEESRPAGRPSSAPRNHKR